MNKYTILFLILLFIIGCTPETITKYQCVDGSFVDSVDLCEEQKCPICPKKVCEKIKEPYVERTDYNYTFKYGVISDLTTGTFFDLTNYGTEQTTKIKNFDDKKGNFTVTHHYRTLKKEGIKEIIDYVDSDETKEFKTTFDTDLGEDVEVTTQIIPPSETRYKEVIKYKEVERCSCE